TRFIREAAERSTRPGHTVRGVSAARRSTLTARQPAMDVSLGDASRLLWKKRFGVMLLPAVDDSIADPTLQPPVRLCIFRTSRAPVRQRRQSELRRVARRSATRAWRIRSDS